MPLVDKGSPGFKRALMIDGIVFSVMPAEMTAVPRPASDYLPMMDAGAIEFQRRPHFSGVANLSDVWTFSIPYDALKPDDLVKMKRIRARGGIHRLTLWRMEPAIFTLQAGVQRIYLPRFRKVAAHLYDGTQLDSGIFANTTDFPTEATLNDASLTVTYAAGPTLADPGAGGIVIAKNPDTSGAARDYTAALLGDTIVAGDELELWTCWTHEVSMQDPELKFSGPQEAQSHTFVEV